MLFETGDSSAVVIDPLVLAADHDRGGGPDRGFGLA
jgi:hypothetical protein